MRKHRLLVDMAHVWLTGYDITFSPKVSEWCRTFVTAFPSPESTGLRVRAFLRAIQPGSTDSPAERTGGDELEEALEARDWECFLRLSKVELRRATSHVVTERFEQVLELADRALQTESNPESPKDPRDYLGLLCSELHTGTTRRGKAALEALIAANAKGSDYGRRSLELGWRFISLYHDCELNCPEGIVVRGELFKRCHDSPDNFSKVQFFVNNSVWLSDTGDYEGARISILEAQKHLDESTPKALEARYLYNRGEVELHSGDAEAAYSCFREAYEICVEHRLDPGRLLIPYALAATRRIRGRIGISDYHIVPMSELRGRWAIDLTSAFEHYRREARRICDKKEWLFAVQDALTNGRINSVLWRAKLAACHSRAVRDWDLDSSWGDHRALVAYLEERGLTQLAEKIVA
jgi:tetratricopeptide (TPR) repeat protein